ncbi:MAG: hypothetical protein KDC00_07015 [Flavobacteriales bacterium]|nr:hypothetical protein [Flavobacteriales bacterium]
MAALQPSNIALGFALGLLLVACGGPETTNDGTSGTDTLAVDPNPEQNQLLAIGGNVFSIPSPVQTALLIRNAGLKYQKDLTLPFDQAEMATGKAAQGMALGMLGADMAYVTVHKDGQRALATMQAIEKLGNKLELANSFDRALIDRFKTNLASEDSLLRFSGTAFRAADQYLKDNKRDDVSAFVLTGGWVESLYLIVSDPTSADDQDLLNRIGEQKNALNSLVALLERTDTELAGGKVLAELKELRVLFEGVSTTYSYQEPVTDAGKKTTFINSTSTVSLAEGSYGAITVKISAIRNLILA